MWYKRSRGFQKSPLGAQIDWGHPLARNLIACFLLNQKTNYLVFDYAKPARSNIMPSGGTLPIWESTQKGPCLKFVNTNDWVEFPVNQSYDLDFSSAFSIVVSFLLAPTQVSPDSALLGKSGTDTDGYPGYFLYLNSSTVDFYINGGIRANSPTTLVADRWYHYVAIWDKANAKIYLDGKLNVSSAYATAPNSAGRIFYLGKYNYGGRSYTGKMDYAYFYNRALTQSEIYWLYREPYCFIQGP